jgi:predicted amidohydrolase YtcJ
MDVLIEDATFVTMASPERARSMLVRDGRIAAVGSAEAVRAQAGPGARVARLDGATVIPGLIDAHCHVSDVGYLAAAADCGQPSAPDIPAIQARLREAAARAPAGGWVTGSGYVEYKLRERRHPARADLDAAVPDRPAVLYHTSLHACVLNTAALREAGFADDQPDPPGAAFAEADAQGLLSQRIYGLVVHDQVDWLLASGLQGRHSGRLATEAVKIWADGGMSSRTAAIHGTYPVPPYGSGILYFGRDELTAMVREFDARGFQVCVHAQGDRAIETVLDAYAATLAPAVTPGNPRRHRIEHGGAMYPALAARAADLGVLVASQPGFLSALGDGFAAAFPGQRDQLYSFASWQRAGITVAGSSDAPVITPDPLVGIRDAMLRRTGEGHVLGPGERLSARAALALYTRHAAFAMHRETEIGSLEPGKLADFAVLDRNPLDVDPERITDIRVLATAVDGKPVYQSGAILPED